MSTLEHPPPSGFDGYLFESPIEIPRVRRQLPVYTIGPEDGPGVIVIHEAGGMSPETLDLARDLTADDQFRVFLPLLFGKPNQERRSGMDLRGMFCIRKEMRFFAADATSPITDLLRHLVVDVVARTGHPRVGVIGMCLTGNLVFGLMAAPAVGTAVSSQPALPFVMPFKPLQWLSSRRKRAGLALDPGDLAASVRSGTPLLAMRFGDDPMCPAERFTSLEEAFEGRDVLTTDVLDGDAHSVLTLDRTPENDRVPKVRAFLADHLAE